MPPSTSQNLDLWQAMELPAESETVEMLPRIEGSRTALKQTLCKSSDRRIVKRLLARTMRTCRCSRLATPLRRR